MRIGFTQSLTKEKILECPVDRNENMDHVGFCVAPVYCIYFGYGECRTRSSSLQDSPGFSSSAADYS